MELGILRFPSLFTVRRLWVGLALCLSLAGFLASNAHAQGGSIRISAGRQIYQPFEGTTQLAGNVKVAMEGTEVTGTHADIQMNDKGGAGTAVFTNGATMVRKASGMKQTIKADTLNMGLQDGSLQAQGKVTTMMSGDKALGDVSIESDTQIFDQEKHVMRAIGHVTVKKQDMIATSPEALIILGSSGAAEKVVFIKGAKLVQGGQEMKGETITIKISTGDIYAEKNTESTMIGKDSDGKPTRVKVLAHLQEIDNKSGTMLANGNTVVNYDDYVAKGPKAVFYRVNNALDRIVMTGRAQIEDTERKVVGDTVTITVNPKKFNAQGNVTTFIKSSNKPKTASTKATTKTTTSPAGSATASQALEEELMIEQETQQSGN